MNTAKAKRALEQVAKQEGVQVDAVRHEIEIAVKAASKSSDPTAQGFWQAIPHKDEFPTPEEVITYIAAILRKH